ncbi:MAG: DUF5119 domain-containing protein [Bacteroidales bacterium]|nr:DUF5119 domain-containing protein [Candidatus Liminaster caballi]
MKNILMHIRLAFVALAALCAVSSCEFRRIMTYDEIYLDHMCVVDYDIDWSQLNEAPSGMTIIFYGCDDQKSYSFHTNTVNHFHAVLPDQDYQMICFNQSESEFALLNFSGFDSFYTAEVNMKPDAENLLHDMLNYINGKNDGTRGFNASGSLQPGSLASASFSSVKKGTKPTGVAPMGGGTMQGSTTTGGTTAGGTSRGFNASGSLQPGNLVSNLTIAIHVVGLKYALNVRGTLDGLSAGRSLATKFPSATTVNQSLPNWNIDASDSDDEPGVITTSVGTFGVPVSGSRADGDPDPNILNLVFTMNDYSEVNFTVNLTEEIHEQYEEIFEEEQEREVNGETGQGPNLEINIEVGTETRPSGDPLDDNPDGTDSNGTLILHRTEGSGFHIGVDGWDDEVIHHIEF